jgi:hypothetical protein
MHRVPEFLSLRRNWVPPPPPPASGCVSPCLDPGGGGGDTIAYRGGSRGPSNSDEGTEFLVLYAHFAKQIMQVAILL